MVFLVLTEVMVLELAGVMVIEFAGIMVLELAGVMDRLLAGLAMRDKISASKGCILIGVPSNTICNKFILLLLIDNQNNKGHNVIHYDQGNIQFQWLKRSPLM